MDQEKKTPSGAPASDTTSALFVSARKKQLEQQEAERRAKEKEEQRLAAEEEARRLEREVEERRRRAEEESRRVEAEAAEKRRQAEEETRRMEAEVAAKKRQAEEEAKRIEIESRRRADEARFKKTEQPSDTYAATSVQTKTTAPFAPPSDPAPSKAPRAPKASGTVPGPFANKKLLIIGGALVAVIALAVILIVSLGGDKTPYLTKSGINVRGSFYDSDFSEICLFLYDDGTADFLYGDGTMVGGTYKISGETVTVTLDDDVRIYEVIDADTLHDQFDVPYLRYTGANPPVSTDPVTVYYDYHDIAGDFVLEDAPDQGAISFFFDGTALIIDFGGDAWYTIDGEELALTMSLDGESETVFFTIIDENTLLHPDGDRFVRDTEYGLYEDDWEINPQAAFDSMASVSDLSLGISFPSNELYVASTAENSVLLTSFDDRANIAFQDIVITELEPDGTVSREQLIALKEMFVTSFSGDIPSLEITVDDLISPRGITKGVISGYYFNDDGEYRYLTAWIGGWINRTTGNAHFYLAVLDCPEELELAYQELYERIAFSVSDI
jgi:hypothetical protein